jgi:hypothetical protein
MIESELILDGHRVHLRGNFAIHHPGEFTAKLKPFRLYHISSFLPSIEGALLSQDSG